MRAGLCWNHGHIHDLVWVEEWRTFLIHSVLRLLYDDGAFGYRLCALLEITVVGPSQTAISRPQNSKIQALNDVGTITCGQHA